MSPHARFALAHPVFDPETQIITGHYWREVMTRHWSVTACLTVNIGME